MPLQPYLDYNTTLEQHILAACILYNGVYVQVHHLLSVDCFYDGSTQQVYEAMVQVWQHGMEVDVMSVTQQLYTKGATALSGISPAAYVSTLVDDALPAANVIQWCIQLRELAARRAIIRITQTQLTGDVVTLATEMQELLTNAMRVRTPNDWLDSSHAAHLLCEQIENSQLHDDYGIATTFTTIDKTNGGLRPGQLVVLGARPAMGKSAMAGGIALAAAQAGKQVGFVSMEMPAQELFARMVSHHTGNNFKMIETPPDGQIDNVLQKVRTLAGLPLHFADDANLTIHDIRARAQQLKHQHGLDLLIVDYLQLIAEHGDSKRSREQQISAISRGLKMIAMSLQIPVIALSQLNRESEHRSNKRPTLADLRESGAIEQDADIVMLLHRDYRSGIEHDAQGNSTATQADLMIVKWRNGSCFDLKLHFNPETMRFGEQSG
jgi:replicative DNA helicase